MEDNLITVMVNEGQVVYHGIVGNKAEGGDIISLDPQDAYELSNAKVIQILDNSEASKLKAKMKKVPTLLQELEKENIALKAMLKNQTVKQDLEKDHEKLKADFEELKKMLSDKFTSNQEESEVIEDSKIEPEDQEEPSSELDSYLKKKGKK